MYENSLSWHHHHLNTTSQLSSVQLLRQSTKEHAMNFYFLFELLPIHLPIIFLLLSSFPLQCQLCRMKPYGSLLRFTWKFKLTLKRLFPFIHRIYFADSGLPDQFCVWLSRTIRLWRGFLCSSPHMNKRHRSNIFTFCNQTLVLWSQLLAMFEMFKFHAVHFGYHFVKQLIYGAELLENTRSFNFFHYNASNISRPDPEIVTKILESWILHTATEALWEVLYKVL